MKYGPRVLDNCAAGLFVVLTPRDTLVFASKDRQQVAEYLDSDPDLAPCLSIWFWDGEWRKESASLSTTTSVATSTGDTPEELEAWMDRLDKNHDRVTVALDAIESRLNAAEVAATMGGTLEELGACGETTRTPGGPE